MPRRSLKIPVEQSADRINSGQWSENGRFADIRHSLGDGGPTLSRKTTLVQSQNSRRQTLSLSIGIPQPAVPLVRSRAKRAEDRAGEDVGGANNHRSRQSGRSKPTTDASVTLPVIPRPRDQASNSSFILHPSSFRTPPAVSKSTQR
jgi:hypothetical protein